MYLRSLIALAFIGSAFAAPKSVVIGKKGGEVLQAIFYEGKYVFRTCDAGSEVSSDKPCGEFSKEQVFDSRAHLYASISQALISSDSYEELMKNQKLRKKEKELLDFAKKFGKDKVDQEELRDIRYDIEVSDAGLKKKGMSADDIQKMSSKIEELVARIESPEEYVDADALSDTIFEELKNSDVFFQDDLESYCAEKYPFKKNRAEVKKEFMKGVNQIITKYNTGWQMANIPEAEKKPELTLVKNPGCTLKIYAVSKSDEFGKAKIMTTLPGAYSKFEINFSDYGTNLVGVQFLNENGKEVGDMEYNDDKIINGLIACFDADNELIVKQINTCLEKEKGNETVRAFTYYEKIIKEGPFKLNPGKKPVFSGDRSSGKDVPSASKPVEAPVKATKK